MKRIRHTVLSSLLAACAAPATGTTPNAPPPAPSPPATASVAPAAQPGGGQDSEVRERPSKTQPWGPEVFQERRQRLMAQIKSGVALVLGPRRFDPSGLDRDSDFMYLTGLTEETGGALLLGPQEPEEEILFLQDANPERDRWTGYRAMLPNRALELKTGFANIRRISTLGLTLTEWAHRGHELHFFGPLVGYEADLPKVLDLYSKTINRAPGAHIKDSVDILTRMRTVKEPREMEKMARAAEITVEGHMEAMRRVRPGMDEWTLKQILEEAFRQRGARDLSYSSIVGAGPDGCILHYINGDHVIKDGELVLIDAAARFDQYASDVTRTFPANGKFTAEQRRLYQIVLAAQNAAFAKVKAGVTWKELEEAATKVIADAGYYEYYIHRLGHFAGLDVHDVGSRAEPLPENAVITLEPGIYVPGKNIGIRIEDVVLVTRKGYRNLSERLPRDPDAIEKLMASGRP